MNEKESRRLLGDPLECRPQEDGPLSDDRSDDQPETTGGAGQKHARRILHTDQDKADIQGEPITRKNDSGLGQPDFKPSSAQRQNIKTVSREEMDRLRQDEEDLSRQFEEKMLELERTGIRIPGSVYRFALWAMIFIGAVLGLFMVNQGVRFAGQVSSLAFPWNILAAAFFLFFLGIILLVIARISHKFLAYKKMARVDLKALNVLAQRKRFQQLALKKKDEARKVLLGYLLDYNVSDPKVVIPGLEKGKLEKLGSIRQSLIDKNEYTDSDKWLKDFDESFVHVLDKAAGKRIRAYARTVAVGTAASPVKIIDQMVVLYASLKLIGELLQIYNLRPAFGQSAAILSRAIIQAYLSGVIGEQSEAGVEAFSEYYESIFGEISFATGISAATDATRFILPKVSEGALNGFLIWRLGKRAGRLVRPI